MKDETFGHFADLHTMDGRLISYLNASAPAYRQCSQHNSNSLFLSWEYAYLVPEFPLHCSVYEINS